MTKISVIIPTYNRASSIVDAIRTVLAQTYTDYEIIVADDGSADNTAQVVQAFGDSVIYMSLPHSALPSVARNRGLGVACGEYVAFLDSDDLFLPEKLSLQTKVLDEFPKVGLVYSDGYYFHDSPDRHLSGTRLTGFPRPSGHIFDELLKINFLSPTTVLVRRSCLDQVGLFDESPELFAMEDYELWLRIAAHFEARYAPGLVSKIHIHGGNISGNWLKSRQRDIMFLRRLEDREPELMNEHVIALSASYARAYGAIGLLYMRHRQVRLALRHLRISLRYGLATEHWGLPELVKWIHRRSVTRRRRRELQELHSAGKIK